MTCAAAADAQRQAWLLCAGRAGYLLRGKYQGNESSTKPVATDRPGSLLPASLGPLVREKVVEFRVEFPDRELTVHPEGGDGGAGR